jgi:hypothetical protein
MNIQNDEITLATSSCYVWQRITNELYLLTADMILLCMKETVTNS